MARAGDTREKMIEAAVDLFALKGYLATSLVDVVEASGTPRGSIYHHFPGGKEQLAEEAASLVKAGIVAWIDQSAVASADPAEMVSKFFSSVARGMDRSGFLRGCPVATVALEMGESGPLASAIDGVFVHWQEVFAAKLAEGGVPVDRARSLAGLAVAALEGALILARVSRSREPLDMAGREVAAAVASTLVPASA